MISSSMLRKRVTIQSPSHTKDATGAVVKGWTDLITVWAQVRPAHGQEAWENAARTESNYINITIRHSSEVAGINNSYRVKYGARRFDIKTVINPMERDRKLTLVCLEGLSDDEN